jgi:alkylhydroperoxidase family enzyme
LAEITAATRIECSWCMDFGYFLAHSQGLDLAKISAVPTWRESDLYTDVERRVLEYTEAVTATPPVVTDDMTEALRKDLGDDGLVELTMMICVENVRSRFNAALGLQSQGFSETCRVPAAGANPKSGAA